MKTHLSDSGEAQYHLHLVDESGVASFVSLNDQLGQPITLRYQAQIACIHCGRKTKKSFNQGYCFVCFRDLAQCDNCIMSPEKCHYDQGTCREPEWADEHCNIEHVVYLANTSGLKVGITRHSQIPTRWIDQGAIQAIPFLRVKTRFHSGLYETALNEFVSDKTAWQQMLKNLAEPLDMALERDAIKAQSESVLAPLQEKLGYSPYVDEPALSIAYPVLEYPTKVKSLNLEKTPEITGTLLGIKGQYLILDIGVINLRKFGGYDVEIVVDAPVKASL